MKDGSSATSTVISYGSFENGTKRRLLRVASDDEELTLPIRWASAEHRSYILATWIRSYMPVLRKWIGKDASPAEEAALAEKLWSKSLVAGPPVDGFPVYAWICGDEGRLDYVYVIPELRNKGVAGALIREMCGPTFEYGRPWPFKKDPAGGSYNPYILGRL